jgi:hypothetical protein
MVTICVGHFSAYDGKQRLGEPDLVHGLAETRFDEGRCRQGRGVQHASRTRDTNESPADGWIGQLNYDAKVVPDLSNSKRRLKRVDVVHFDAHDGERMVKVGLE